FTDDLRVKNARGGVKRVDGWIDTQLGQLSGQHGGRVQVGKGCSGRRVGQVVCRHIDRLHRGDGSPLRRGDALLELPHFGRQGWLVADGGGHTSEQGGHF